MFSGMVVTCYRAHSPAGVVADVPAGGVVNPDRTSVVDTDLEDPGCRECLAPLPEAGRDGLLSRCAVVAELCQQVEEL